ncbi:FAD-dependent oxidoreductase [Rhodococcus globerulus]|uniref:FAD-dependent oxidoreductase n=1 Tax=Rhodococcus globerulus TaxID=33008 RepID=UPI003016A900
MTTSQNPTDNTATEQVWDEEYDVVVVGSGGGALTAAYTAGVEGLRTLVLEKTPLFGGVTTYAGAAIWFPGNQIEMEGDPGDSVDLAREYLSHLLDDSAKAHYETYLETGPTLVDFLTAHPDINFTWNKFPDYFDQPGRRTGGRSIWPAPIEYEKVGEFLPFLRPALVFDRANEPHPEAPITQGRALIASLLLAGRSTGNVTFRTETPVMDLVVQDGRVIGVQAEHHGRSIHVRATHGVVIAAGGYESNAGLRTATNTPGDAAWTMSPGGANTGDLITAGIRIGAATELMGDAWWNPGIELSDGRPAVLVCIAGGIMIDGSGTRFCNEASPYDQAGRRMAGNLADGSTSGGTPHEPAWFVFDSRNGGKLPAISLPGDDLERCIAAGTLVRADSVVELSEKIGVPPQALADTVTRFNDAASTGVDADFHRGEDPYDLAFAAGTGPNPALVPLDQGPYYAARMVIADLGTKGGLRIDTDGRVLKKNGGVLGGLYACGNSTASMTGHTYPGPGLPIGLSMLFGYRAVKHIAAAR